MENDSSSRDDDLIPWQVQKQHRWAYPALMLRAEMRRRAGQDLGADQETRLDRWLSTMRRDGTVVDYDPASDEGFRYLPRSARDEEDLIRRPQS